MIFQNPMTLSFNSELMFLLPLCAAVALVYKTVRIDHLRRLPRQAAGLWIYMLAGLAALGAGMWVIQRLCL